MIKSIIQVFLMIILYLLSYSQIFAENNNELFFERKACIFFCEKNNDSTNIIFSKNDRNEYTSFYKKFVNKDEYLKFCTSNKENENICDNSYQIEDKINGNIILSSVKFEKEDIGNLINNFTNEEGLFPKLRFILYPTNNIEKLKQIYDIVDIGFKKIPFDSQYFDVEKPIVYNSYIYNDLYELGEKYIKDNSSLKKIKIYEGFVKLGDNNVNYNLSIGTSFLFPLDDEKWLKENASAFGFYEVSSEKDFVGNEYTSGKVLYRWVGVRLLKDFELYKKFNKDSTFNDFLRKKVDNLISLNTEINKGNIFNGINFYDDIKSHPFFYYKVENKVIDILKNIEEKYSFANIANEVFGDRNVNDYIYKSSEYLSIDNSYLNNSLYKENDKNRLTSKIFSTSDIFRFFNLGEDYKNNLILYTDYKKIFLTRKEYLKYGDRKMSIKDLGNIILNKYKDGNKILDISKYSSENSYFIKKDSEGKYLIPSKVYLNKSLYGAIEYNDYTLYGKNDYLFVFKKEGMYEKNILTFSEISNNASLLNFERTVFENIIVVNNKYYFGFSLKDGDKLNNISFYQTINNKSYFIKNINNEIFFVITELNKDKNELFKPEEINKDIRESIYLRIKDKGNLSLSELRIKKEDSLTDLNNFAEKIGNNEEYFKFLNYLNYTIVNNLSENKVFLIKNNKIYIYDLDSKKISSEKNLNKNYYELTEIINLINNNFKENTDGINGNFLLNFNFFVIFVIIISILLGFLYFFIFYRKGFFSLIKYLFKAKN